MISAPDIHQLRPGLALWHAFDPSVKADLYSTAISVATGFFLIDPIPIPRNSLDELLNTTEARGIVITNHNHWRNAQQLADQLSIPIFACDSTDLPEKLPPFVPVSEGTKIGDTLEVITIPGAVPGEIALFSAADGGTLVMGDALINFEPYGFTFLPGKYCSNPKEMRRSLRKLLNWKVERILFAHGTPVLSAASKRLRDLLDSSE